MDSTSDKLSDKLLEPTVLDMSGPEAELLLESLTAGIASIARGPLPREARRLLEKYREGALPLVATYLLERVALGEVSPTYDQYIAVKPLTAPLERDDASLVGRTAAATVLALVRCLLSSPAMESIPDRLRIEQIIKSILDDCDALQFGPGSVFLPPVDLLRFVSVPQSPFPVERFFLAATQTEEVLFAAASLLFQRAADAVAHGRVSLATYCLHEATALVDVLLPKLFRLLLPLEPEEWARDGGIRTYIERPSAIQSRHFRSYTAALGTLHVNLTAHRPPKWEFAQVPAYRSAVTAVCEAHRRWYAQHLAVVRKYTPGGSEAYAWLTRRMTEIRRCPHCDGETDSPRTA